MDVFEVADELCALATDLDEHPQVAETALLHRPERHLDAPRVGVRAALDLHVLQRFAGQWPNREQAARQPLGELTASQPTRHEAPIIDTPFSYRRGELVGDFEELER